MTRTHAPGEEQPSLLGWLSRPTGYVSGPQVLTELRRAIVSGQVPPGTAIPLDEVADFFGVSRIPVREALKPCSARGSWSTCPAWATR